MTNLLLIMGVFALCMCSAFFAGAETGIYRLSKFRLRLGVEQHKPFYKQLARAVKDGQGLILSLLLGNNIINYLATMLTTWILLRMTQSESRTEFYTTVIITPTLFIFAEIIPKSVFFYRADRLVGMLAPAVWATWRLFTLSGAIWFLRWLLRLLSKIFGVSVDTAAAVDVTQRGQVRQLIQETREEGLLSSLQKDMMQRLAALPEVAVGTIVIPLAKVDMAEVNSGRPELMQILERCSHRRILVYEKDRHNILGFIELDTILASNSKFTDLRSFISPIFRLNVSASVLDAISILRKGNHGLTVVTADSAKSPAESKKILGILTLKDLVEELTGELTAQS